MTVTEIISQVRQLIQDVRVPHRYSDVVLVGFINQTLNRMVLIRPDLFTIITSVPTTPGVLQTLPADAVRLVQVYGVIGGNVITEVSRETLDQTSPGWMSATAGTPVSFVRHVRNPYKYLLSPPPTALDLMVEYVQQPATVDVESPITGLPNVYLPAVVDGVVFLAESVDNEHVNSGRAKLFQDSFAQLLGAGLQSRVITDVRDGGLGKGEVF